MLWCVNAEKALFGGSMKINAQLEALVRQQEQSSGVSRSSASPEKSFGAALAQQMELASFPAQAGTPVPTVQAGQASMISQMLLGETQPATADADASAMQAAFALASGTLDMWDSYRAALGGGGQGSLREAYALLQGIDGQVSALGKDPARGQNPGLDSLLTELEVLTATEKFKFNRGDYSG